MKYLLLCLFLSGCANMPYRYGETVIVIGGEYKGQKGRLIKDCDGFENYKVELFNNNRRVCVRIWNLERIYW